MRKLVYIGKDNIGNIFETSSFTEMQEMKTKGFQFTEKMVEIKEEKPMSEKVQKIIEKKIAKMRG